jgi:hypothetical protein
MQKALIYEAIFIVNRGIDDAVLVCSIHLRF